MGEALVLFFALGLTLGYFVGYFQARVNYRRMPSILPDSKAKLYLITEYKVKNDIK